MRFSTLLLALIPATALAAPVPAPGIIDDFLEKIPVVGAVVDAIKHPDLLGARIKVLEGLTQTETALEAIIAETINGANTSIVTASQAALKSVNNAQEAAKAIFKAVLSSTPPERTDQTTVATNVATLKGQVNELAKKVLNPSNELTNQIDKATKGMKLAAQGTQDVVDASGLSLEDVGLKERLV